MKGLTNGFILNHKAHGHCSLSSGFEHATKVSEAQAISTVPLSLPN